MAGTYLGLRANYSDFFRLAEGLSRYRAPERERAGAQVISFCPGVSDTHSTAERRQKVLKAQIEAARACLRRGQAGAAERLLKDALSGAEFIFGKDSALSASVLIELFDLYQKQGRREECQPLWSRICNIAGTLQTA
jgi:hypothetical protein